MTKGNDQDEVERRDCVEGPLREPFRESDCQSRLSFGAIAAAELRDWRSPFLRPGRLA